MLSARSETQLTNVKSMQRGNEIFLTTSDSDFQFEDVPGRSWGTKVEQAGTRQTGLRLSAYAYERHTPSAEAAGPHSTERLNRPVRNEGHRRIIEEAALHSCNPAEQRLPSRAGRFASI
jgi:hypothetical protein